VRAGLAAIGRAQYSRLQEGKTRGGSHLEGDWRVVGCTGRPGLGWPSSAAHPAAGSAAERGDGAAPIDWPSRRTAPATGTAGAGAAEGTKAGA
jgi:hypothetical protein